MGVPTIHTHCHRHNAAARLLEGWPLGQPNTFTSFKLPSTTFTFIVQEIICLALPCIVNARSSPARQDAVVERLAADPFPNNKLHAEAQVIRPEGQPEGIGKEGQAGKGKAGCVWGAMRWLNDK